ncbi:MAG: chemotaxis response regulator protein-glutamate methylesterase [Chromatiales bacterium]|jgi:two-component system chemotaxis response regulator CheB
MVQPVRVLVVDDSRFFQRRIIELLESDARLKVVDTAADGQEAVAKALELRPDVVTMDIEMPVMDGITAVRRIMRRRPMPILMFSSLTHEGAKATLDALEAGAMDFLPKSFEDIAKNRDEVRRLLCRRVHSLGLGAARAAQPAVAAAGSAPAPARPERRAEPPSRRAMRPSNMDVLAIGASTGGPVALQKVLTPLPGHFRWPILLVQHMPSTFTGAFAERLNQQCDISVREAADGDVVKPGLALLAPGGKQMVVESIRGVVRVRITESEPDQHYRPSVDITFGSVAQAYPGRSLGVVLTGMGADGREGARAMKNGGASIWAQDEATSVIYGMPAAVAEAGLADCILPISQIGSVLAKGS